MTDGRPWWERHPTVLDEEVADLQALADGDVVLDDALLDAAQVRRYCFAYTLDGETYDLEVTFADHHPYFQPKVTATQRFNTHQQPFDGGLCLLLGDTFHWDISETAAELISHQLPGLVTDSQEAGEAAAAGPPEPIAHVEPYVGYYTYEVDTSLRIGDTTEALDGVDEGSFTVALDRFGFPGTLRGVILEVRDTDGTARWSAPDAWKGMYEVQPKLVGRWVRLPERPADDGADGVLAAAAAVDPKLLRPDATELADRTQLDVTGVCFDDSIRPFERGDAWIFVVRGHGQPPEGRAARVKHKGRVTEAPPRPRVGPYLARAHRADRRAMTERTPSVASLADKHVVVFGTGGVGAPVAIELAKAGLGELTLVECDQVDPGNAPRWPLGFGSAGLVKNGALGNFIHSNWPYTTVRVCPGKIGAPRLSGEGPPEWEALDTLLETADLVVDATAEIGMAYFLSDLTRDKGVPLVVASTTEGGWGGRIVHLGTAPDDPCWMCVLKHTEDETIPVPPADPDPATGNVHPAGCVTPTFTGTGFDVASISLAATRLIASVLTSGAPGGYPVADWNAAIYEFRDADHAKPGPAQPFVLTRHPGCDSCNQRASG